VLTIKKGVKIQDVTVL